MYAGHVGRGLAGWRVRLNPPIQAGGIAVQTDRLSRIDPSDALYDNLPTFGKHQSKALERIMPCRPPHRRCFVIALTLLVALQFTPPAWVWGRLGHRVISRLAEKQLTKKAKTAIAELLTPGESLADASTWADEVRRQMNNTAPWHYVDVPLDEPKYDSKYSGPKVGCVVDKINEFKLAIEDKSKSIEDRRFALRFLIHCLEDMHMPMHVGDNHDKGGNQTQVRFFDRGTNMHSLWDCGMIARVSSKEDFWLADLGQLDTPENRQAAMKGTVEDWATESLLAAKQAYQVPEIGKRLKSGQKLGDAYVKANVPVVRQRLYWPTLGQYLPALRAGRVVQEASSSPPARKSVLDPLCGRLCDRGSPRRRRQAHHGCLTQADEQVRPDGPPGEDPAGAV
jgi:nuclease S1